MIDIACRYCTDRARLYDRAAKCRERAQVLEALALALLAALVFFF